MCNYFDLGFGYNKLYDLTKTHSLIKSQNPPKYIKRIKAKEYWDEIIKSAHGYAIFEA